MRENAIIKESTELLHQARNNGSITKKEEKTKSYLAREYIVMEVICDSSGLTDRQV